MQRPNFPSERNLISVGKLLGTRIGLTISVATLLSMTIASVISYVVRGQLTIYSPLIAAACCISTALPIHLLLRGYYTLIMKQKDRLESQQDQLQDLNAMLRDANRDLAAFSHRVAHDLRNPLAVIQLNAYQLKASDTGANTEEIADIISANHNAEEIITSILLLSKARQAPPALLPCDIYDCLDGALRSLQHRLQSAQITVSVVKKQDLRALAHAPWLERVWVNLIDNAMKYGGEDPQITAGASPQDDGIRCWVSDNGSGIPNEAKRLIFNDFQQQSESTGFGLGLAMVTQLLKHMNGRIEVEDGEGTTFAFYLPAHTGVAQDKQEPEDFGVT